MTMQRLLPNVSALLSGFALAGLIVTSATAQDRTAPSQKNPPTAVEKTRTPAQGQKSLVRLAIIDVEAIRRQTAVVKDILGQIEKYRAGFQAEIKKEEDALRSANEELTRQRAILSPEAFAEERRKFEQRLEGVQRLLQKRKQELDDVRNEAMRTVQGALNDVVAELAQERRLTLILRKNQTILAAKALDITPIVLKRMDKKLPNLKVRKPGN